MSDGGKGSGRRPGENFEQGWERIFGKKYKPEQPSDQQQDKQHQANPVEQKK